jgi:hypothetical protein
MSIEVAELVYKLTLYISFSIKPILSESIMWLTTDIVILPEPMYETWQAVVLQANTSI